MMWMSAVIQLHLIIRDRTKMLGGWGGVHIYRFPCHLLSFKDVFCLNHNIRISYLNMNGSSCTSNTNLGTEQEHVGAHESHSWSSSPMCLCCFWHLASHCSDADVIVSSWKHTPTLLQHGQYEKCLNVTKTSEVFSWSCDSFSTQTSNTWTPSETADSAVRMWECIWSSEDHTLLWNIMNDLMKSASF